MNDEQSMELACHPSAAQFQTVGPIPESAATPEWARRTAEARRLGALAARFGMSWAAGASPDPATWYSPDRRFDAAEEDEHLNAVDVARQAENRRKSMDIVKERRGDAKADDQHYAALVVLLDTGRPTLHIARVPFVDYLHKLIAADGKTDFPPLRDNLAAAQCERSTWLSSPVRFGIEAEAA
jgi:hypothetical protein